MAADGSSTSSQRRLSLSTLFIEACDVAVTHRYMFMLQLAGAMLHCYNLCNDVTCVTYFYYRLLVKRAGSREDAALTRTCSRGSADAVNAAVGSCRNALYCIAWCNLREV